MLYYMSVSEWKDNDYFTVTKVFDSNKQDASWRGCHWNNPAIIACEMVKGLCMSKDMQNFITDKGVFALE